ncbi:MAG: hypothetical protein ACK5XN_24895 [Bacteroidota bacterium]
MKYIICAIDVVGVCKIAVVGILFVYLCSPTAFAQTIQFGANYHIQGQVQSRSYMTFGSSLNQSQRKDLWGYSSEWDARSHWAWKRGPFTGINLSFSPNAESKYNWLCSYGQHEFESKIGIGRRLDYYNHYYATIFRASTVHIGVRRIIWQNEKRTIKVYVGLQTNISFVGNFNGPMFTSYEVINGSYYEMTTSPYFNKIALHRIKPWAFFQWPRYFSLGLTQNLFSEGRFSCIMFADFVNPVSSGSTIRFNYRTNFTQDDVADSPLGYAARTSCIGLTAAIRLNGNKMKKLL